MQVGLTLGQRRDDSTDVGPTLGQPTLLSGLCIFNFQCTNIQGEWIYLSPLYKPFFKGGPELTLLEWYSLMGIAVLLSYPGYFREPCWLSMGLPEISRATLTGVALCLLGSDISGIHNWDWSQKIPSCDGPKVGSNGHSHQWPWPVIARQPVAAEHLVLASKLLRALFSS